MRSGIFKKILAIVLVLQLMLGAVPVQAFALNEESPSVISVEESSEIRSEEETLAAPQNTEQTLEDLPAAESEGAFIQTDTTGDEDGHEDPGETTHRNETALQDPASDSDSDDMTAYLPDEESAVSEDKVDFPSSEQTVDSDDDRADTADGGEGANTTGKTEVHATSMTNNIVGDVLAGQLNKANSEEAKAQLEEALEKYPLDPHDLSYYGDSLRVRFLDEEIGEDPNYLVYRDSYLIFSQKESANYETALSEDGKTAYVTPAISEDLLAGKHGIVFLGDNVSEDTILVFGGDPVTDGDSLVVPIKDTADISVSELFSDGYWVIKSESKPMLRAGASWNTHPEGTNWKGELTSFSADWPRADTDINVWKLYFMFVLELRFEVGFNISTTGASNGRESVRLVGVSVPMGLLNLSVNYSMVVQFDEKPIQIEGSMLTQFSMAFGTYPAEVRQNRTMVDFKKVKVVNEADYNKEINFYIGSSISASGSFLHVKIDLWLFDIDFGPLLSLTLAANGGSSAKAKYRIDEYDAPDLSADAIHTCTENGKAGCLELQSTETSRKVILITLDLYFDDWTWTLLDNSEKVQGVRNFYSSETYQSGLRSGLCPHEAYRVPVAVWLDAAMTVPLADMDVTVADALEFTEGESSLVTGKTDSSGMTAVFLPYQEGQKYTLLASGRYQDQSLAGSAVQQTAIQTSNNPRVDIVVQPDERIHIVTDVVWNIDLEGKHIPSYNAEYINPNNTRLRVRVFRREAGTDNEWESVAYCEAERSEDWEVEEFDFPKYGVDGDRTILYEYRVRLVEYTFGGNYGPDTVITPEGTKIIYRYVASYMDARGNRVNEIPREPFFIEYDTVTMGDTLKTTITASPMTVVQVDKIWELADPLNQAPYVFLALLEKPETGLEDKARERGVPTDWTLLKEPFTGKTNSLRQLETKEIATVYDDLSSIENVPLAVGIVDDGNGWHLTYQVPRFRNGIEMQYQAVELDRSIIEQFLRAEYDIDAVVSVQSFGDYYSLVVPAFNESFREYKNTKVINMDPLPANTIAGTVRWRDFWDKVPEYVELTILKNGEPLDIDPIVLQKADFEPGTLVWTWKLELEDYDPDAEYTVVERLGPILSEFYYTWIPTYHGLDVFNVLIRGEYVHAEIRAYFEDEPAIDELHVTLDDKTTGVQDITLSKSENWYFDYTGARAETVADISEYEFTAPDVDGYVHYYGEPIELTWWDDALRYWFSVYYVRQSEELKLHLETEWLNTDESTVYPVRVPVEVYRDDIKIADVVLRKVGDNWETAVIDCDLDDNPLHRVDEDFHKYAYTFITQPIDGFTTEIVEVRDDIDDIYYSIRNTWVGEDYINLKGTVKWEGDEGKEKFRPEKVRLSVVNDREEFIKSIDVPVDGDGNYEVKFLPGSDEKGEPYSYTVLESHVTGYTTTYTELTPEAYDDETRTWTIDVTNTLTGYFPLTLKKEIKGTPENKNETYKFEVSAKNAGGSEDHEMPLPVNKDDLKIQGEGEIKAEFLLDEPGVYYYSIKEISGDDTSCIYDTKEKLVLIAKTHDGEDGWKFTSWVKEADGSEDNDSFFAGGTIDEVVSENDQLDDLKSDTVTFTNLCPSILVEKTWDIDLERKDRPDSIEVVVQKNSGGSWENVKLLELNEENDWKQGVFFDDDPEGKDTYRVRELKEESGLADLIRNLKGIISGGATDTFDYVWSSIKDSDYYDTLPDNLKNAGEEGEARLREALGAGTEDLYDKLIEQLGLSTADSRIVYDKNDSDNSEEETNEITYQVDGYVSVISGIVGTHKTKYRVTYVSDGRKHTIDNKAILDIDIVKKWYSWGVEDEDMPDSAWLVLMCKPSAGVLDNAADLASAAGIDLGGVLDYEFPVINPLEGGMDPLSLISELTLGVDLNIFSDLGIIPKLAIGKAEKANDGGDKKDWRVEFTVSKYNMGIPMEYKGAELSSEVIRQIIKYLTKLDLPVSFNPFDGYISIPGKAKGSTENWSISELDLSKLIEAGKNFTQGDLDLMDIKSLFESDTDLLASVINIKIDWDTDNDDKLEGSKTWVGDTEANRPEWIKIHIKDGNKEIEGSPITLNKSDFKGKDVWKWELDLPDDADEDAKYVVSEEWPEDFANKDHYTVERDGLDLTNKWSNTVPETVTISGEKIWKDGGDRDGLRPETITVYLLADGVRVKDAEGNDLSVETSKTGEWKYFFPNQPRLNESGSEIVYSVEEDEVDEYTSETDGYNLINSYTPKKVTVSGSKEWNDDDDKDGIRPDSITIRLLANGTEVDSKTVTADDDWAWTFEDLYKNEGGKEIEYTVSEDLVEGYETEITGFNVKNTHIPSTISINGSKTWDDDNNASGARPESIVIRLRADGAEVAKKTVTEKDGWSWRFVNLPKYADGEEIVYTVTEDALDDYVSQIDGFNITNTYAPGSTSVTLGGTKRLEGSKRRYSLTR